MPRYAAIDIGSNSVKMLAAEVGAGDEMVTLAEDREVTRLGASVFETGSLSQEAMDTVCRVLERMAKRYRQHQVLAVRAVATAAVRDASNQRIFLERAAQAIESPVEIISGLEEARLIHLGVQSRWPHPEERILIVDIGGGSVEFILGEDTQFEEAFSKPMGAVRMTGMFLDNDPPSAAELAQMEEYIEERMAPAVTKFRRKKVARVIATAGTAAAVVRAVNKMSSLKRDVADGKLATIGQIRRIYKNLAGMKLAKRRRVVGIGARRAEIILPGVAVLRHALEAFGQPALYYSSAGLRDGIVADLWNRKAGAAKTQMDRDQRRAVEQLAARFGVDLRHAKKIAAFAHSLFVSLYALHRLPPSMGKLLEASAHLIDTGHFISDTAHHKHSEYVVANADLPGFTDAERRIVAALVRFHRKSMPGARHLNFQALAVEDRRSALLLIPLLRLADALDRGHEQRVRGLECQVRLGAVTVMLETNSEVDLEFWASERVAEIFQQSYGHSLTVAVR